MVMKSGIALAAATALCSVAAPRWRTALVAHARAGSVPLLVFNTSGMPIEIRGYADFNPPVHQDLGGALRLGTVAPASSACLAIPDTFRITLYGPSERIGDTSSLGGRQVLVWSAKEHLTVTALDTLGHLAGQTRSFTPASATGWRVALPDSARGLAAALPCPA